MIAKKFSQQLLVVFTALAWLSLLPGQLVRLQLSGLSQGLLLVDILVVLVALPSVVYVLWHNKELWKDRGVQLLGVWLLVAAVSWAVASLDYSAKSIVVGLGYLVRLWAYALTFILATHFAKSITQPFLHYAIVTVVGLFFLGLLVLQTLPDFASLALEGWDPHVGRFTSTWLDPNYIGSFFALVIGAGLSFEKKYFANKRAWLLLMLFLVICVVGIYLTISRSAMITLAVASLIAGLRTSKRAIGIAVVFLVILALTPSRLQDRLLSSASFLGGVASSDGGATATDPTANARVDSWKRAWDLAKDAPLLGVGYNYFEAATVKKGLVDSNATTRGTTSSDSSALTLLATTGWIGLLAAVGFFGYLAYRFLFSKGIWSTVGLSLLVAMAVGSMLNNLLLYPLIFLPFMLALGIAYSTLGHQHE